MSVPGPTVNIVIVWDWVAAVRARLRQPWADRHAFDALEFVIVDVETTGWSPEEAGITEIGAVRMSGGQIRAEFSTLVNPGQPIPPDIVALTGISDAMVGPAPQAAAALASFRDFAQGAVLTAHNAPFDISFLTAASASCGLPGPAGPVLDTVVLARRLLATGGLAADDVPNCKLSTLAGYFGAPPGPQHRALADARATATVLAGLLEMFSARRVRTVAGLLAEQEYALLSEAPRHSDLSDGPVRTGCTLLPSGSCCPRAPRADHSPGPGGPGSLGRSAGNAQGRSPGPSGPGSLAGPE